MTGASIDIPHSLQELPPKWAHFCLHIEQFVRDELFFELGQKKLVVAFSGGVDSTALLLCLYYLSQKNNGNIIAAHLNHQLRPESTDDAVWAANLCSHLGITYIQKDVDVASLAEKMGIGVEEAGRNARYNFFHSVKDDNQADAIAVGHHLGDLCEDVLMRLIRGTGWPGLSGMEGWDEKRKLFRPFLLTNKGKLEAFLSTIGATWREDLSNSDQAWTRNRVRCTLLPLFLKENPNFPKSIARLWKLGRIDKAFWDDFTAETPSTILHKTLESSHQAVRLRMYKAALDSIGKGQALADTLFKLDEAWQENRVGVVFQFPNEKTATITSSGVVFSSKH
ncbi:tRNA lysidine(34) synthetase TilS [Pseudodesulfovibrio sp. zrk46]|nr:tRNA lysidine(34) synthetase TilS [Pseudodesulfovibrio sp. zrk46]